MKTTATLIATLMLSAMGCAYAQGGPGERMEGPGAGAPGIEGPRGGGAPAIERGGPTSPPGPGSAERGPSRGEASGDGPARRSAEPAERGERRKSAAEADRGDEPKARRERSAADDEPKARRERRVDDDASKADKSEKAAKRAKPDEKAAERAKSDEKAGDTQKRAKTETEERTKEPKESLTKKDDDAAKKDADTARADTERAKQVELTGDKRERVQTALREKTDVKHRTDVDIDISIGRRLPRDWDFAPLPIVVVEIVPEYRDYVYVWVEDEYVICDPVTYEVVAVIPASGRRHAESRSGGVSECSTRITLSEDERELILRSVRGGDEVDVANLTVGWSVPGDIVLEEFPEPVLSEASELSACRYFIAEDQLAIVDPEDDKVVLLIDRS